VEAPPTPTRGYQPAFRVPGIPTIIGFSSRQSQQISTVPLVADCGFVMGCCSSSQAGEPGQRLGNTPDDRADKAARAAAAAERRQGENTHRQGTSGISAERQDAMRERQVRDELIGKAASAISPDSKQFIQAHTTQKTTMALQMYKLVRLQEKLRVAVKQPDKTSLLAFEQAVWRRLDGSGRACSQGHNSGQISSAQQGVSIRYTRMPCGRSALHAGKAVEQLPPRRAFFGSV